MDETKHSHHRHEAGDDIHHVQRPYWKRAHTDWRVWVGLFFMLAAMTIYIMSDDLAFLPGAHPHRTSSGAAGKQRSP